MIDVKEEFPIGSIWEMLSSENLYDLKYNKEWKVIEIYQERHIGQGFDRISTTIYLSSLKYPDGNIKVVPIYEMGEPLWRKVQVQ